jgi:hypothetical protein
MCARVLVDPPMNGIAAANGGCLLHRVGSPQPPGTEMVTYPLVSFNSPPPPTTSIYLVLASICNTYYCAGA